MANHLYHILREVTVEPVVFLYMFTNFLYVPVLQSLIFDKVCLTKFTSELCSNIRNDSDNPHYHAVNSETSHWILMTSVALLIPSAICVLLFYGVLGDKLGRKVPVILPCFGALAAYISAMLNAHFMSGSMYFVLIGPLLNGICGGYVAGMMAFYSYVGHVASRESKMTRISIVESSIFIAGTIGIFVSGVILHRIGYEYTFLVLTTCICLAIVYSLLCLKNVKTNEQTNASERSCVGMMAAYVKESVQCVGKKRNGRVLSLIVLQVICINFLMFCTAGDIDICFIYLRERLNYNQVLYGFYKGLDNFLRGITLLFIPRLARQLFNVDDFLLVLVGLVSYVANCVVLAFASAKWLPFLAAIVGMFKGFPAAGLRSKMSSLVSQNEQGRLFGLIAASESITSLLATLVFNSAFPPTYKIFPGLCYMLGVVLLVGAFILTIFIKRRYSSTTSGDGIPDPRYDPLEEDVAIVAEDIAVNGGDIQGRLL